MKFRAIIRSLQTLIIVTVAPPLVAQPTQPAVNSSGPANTTPQLSAPKTDISPILTPEPSVNNPTTTQPPVITPAPNPTPPLAPPPKPVAKRAKADSLKPGQFMWENRDSYSGRLKIVIVLNVQRIYVFHDDKLVGFSTISSGKKGKETPTGIFNILQKNIDHKSNLYSNAPMPYMQRLTWDGIALHGGHIPGHPASHGCIRLPQAFAKALFGATKMNQEVFVLSDVDTPVTRPVVKPVPVIDPPVVPPVVDQPVEPVVVPPVTPEGTSPNSKVVRTQSLTKSSI